MRRALVPSVAFLAGALVAWVLTTRPTGDGSASEAPRQAAAPEGEDLRETLAAMRSALERLDARLSALELAPAAPPSPRADARRPVPAIEAERLAELTAAVDELRRAVEAGLPAGVELRDPEPTLEELRAQHPVTDWNAVHGLIDLWSADPAAARQDTMLLSQRDLLKRFGTPTELWGGDGVLNWFYQEGYDAAAETYLVEVYFRLNDGYVTLLNVDRN